MTTREENKIYTLEEGLEIMDAIINDEEYTKKELFKEYQSLEKKAAAIKVDGFWTRDESRVQELNIFKNKLTAIYGDETMELLRVYGLKAALRGYVSKTRIGKMKKSTGCYGIEA